MGENTEKAEKRDSKQKRGNVKIVNTNKHRVKKERK